MPGKKSKGQLHTATHMRTVVLGINNTLLLRRVNRARRVKLDVYTDEETMSQVLISTVRVVVPGTVAAPGAFSGSWKLVNPTIGEDFILGPDQNLYGRLFAAVQPDISVVSMVVEDNINEGIYTDIGSGVDSPGPDRGPGQKKPQQAVTTRATRSVKKQ